VLESMLSALQALSMTEYAAWVRESNYGWAISLTLHAFGNAAVIGLSFIIALRIFGFFRTIPFTSLSRLFPIIWISVVVQVLSGSSLWMTKPDKYVLAGMFDAKFTFVVLGCIVTAYFQSILRKEAAAWQASGKVPPHGAGWAAATALIWAAVLMTGRLTAYLGTLYS
jgi:hypothetical protein